MGLFKRFKAPKATISVILDKQAFSLNEPMTGKLSVSSSEEFDADELRIELWVTEETRATGSVTIRTRAGSETKNVTVQQSANLHKGKITVAGRTHITHGFKEEFPFSIPLPSGIPPTYHGRNARNTWKIKGVIAVKGRPDVTSHDMEVQINP